MRLPPEATIELLSDLEQRFPVSSWTMDGVHVWPIVRSAVWWTVNVNFAQQHARLHAENRVLRRARQATQLPRDWSRAARARIAQADQEADLRRPADVILLGDNVSRIPLEGAWYDRLCQPVIEELAQMGASSLHIEPYHRYRGPRAHPSARIQVPLDLLWIRSRLTLGSRRESLDGYEAFLRMLRETAGPAAGMELTVLRRQVAYLLLMTQWFQRMFNRVRPRLAMNVDLGIVQMAFHLACRRSGIESIEIQHGAVRDNHANFSAWTNVPPDGFDLLPSAYWVWSEAEARIIRSWSKGTEPLHRPIIGGNLWLQRWLEGGSDLVARFDALVKPLRAVEPGALTVLLALQTDVTSMRDLDAVRAAIATSPPNWRWWVRRHPTMGDHELMHVRRFLGGGHRVLIDEPSALPLYALLRWTDVHVTQRSSVVEEAAAFGVPSVITEAAAAVTTFESEMRSGWAVIGEDSVSLLESIVFQHARRQEIPPAVPRRDHSARELLTELLRRSS